MAKGPSKTSGADVQLLTVECAAAYSEICKADAKIRTAVFFVEVAVFFVGDAVFLCRQRFLVKSNDSTQCFLQFHKKNIDFSLSFQTCSFKTGDSARCFCKKYQKTCSL